MANVLIVAYLLIVLALIVVILLQRSEGGALGIGGGSGGGLVSARGSANLLSRTTAILGIMFMGTAIALSIVADLDRSTDNILDTAEQGTETTSVLDALNALSPSGDNSLAIPDTDSSGGGETPDTTSNPDLPVPNSSTPSAPTGGTN